MRSANSNKIFKRIFVEIASQFLGGFDESDRNFTLIKFIKAVSSGEAKILKLIIKTVIEFTINLANSKFLQTFTFNEDHDLA